MKEFELKYGCNPNQKPAKIFCKDGGELPVKILNGRPGYINFLDALNGWQLVRDLKAATGLPSATSFKHVSPAEDAKVAGLTAPARIKERRVGYDAHALLCLVHTQNSRVELGLV